jgi:hypothetical protein
MTVQEALDRGLRSHLEAAKPEDDGSRSVFGQSEGDGTRYHAIQDRNRVMVLLVPPGEGTAEEVQDVADDVVWNPPDNFWDDNRD